MMGYGLWVMGHGRTGDQPVTATQDRQLAGWRAAENRLMEHAIELMGISTWPRAEKMAAIQPSIVVWRRQIFAQLSRGVPEVFLRKYLDEQHKFMNGFRGRPSFEVFRKIEKMSPSAVDRGYDAQKVEHHRASLPPVPPATRSALDQILGAIMRQSRNKRDIVSLCKCIRALARAWGERPDLMTPDHRRARVDGLLDMHRVELSEEMRERLVEAMDGRDADG